MTIKLLVLTLVFSGISLFTYEIYGQQTEMSIKERNRMDSLKEVNNRIQNQQRAKDANTLDQAKRKSKESETNEQEAKRIEKDASDATKQSKKAVKAEKKAQKARTQADKQAQKASEARGKSDNN